MIHQKETLKTILEFRPQVSVIPYPRVDFPNLIGSLENTLRDFWLKLPIIYIRTVICVITVSLGISVGLIIPWLAESLDRFMKIVILVLTYG
jgi:hypothetical protein